MPSLLTPCAVLIGNGNGIRFDLHRALRQGGAVTTKRNQYEFLPGMLHFGLGLVVARLILCSKEASCVSQSSHPPDPRHPLGEVMVRVAVPIIRRQW